MKCLQHKPSIPIYAFPRITQFRVLPKSIFQCRRNIIQKILNTVIRLVVLPYYFKLVIIFKADTTKYDAIRNLSVDYMQFMIFYFPKLNAHKNVQLHYMFVPRAEPKYNKKEKGTKICQ